MDIDHILQYLIPIIFLIVWVIGRAFNPKKAEAVDEMSEEEESRPFEEVFEESFEQYEDSQEQEKRVKPVYEAVVRQGEKVVFSPVNLPSTSVSRYDAVSAALQKDIKKLNTTSKLTILSNAEEARKSRRRVEILKLLKEPHAMRKVVLTYEILGPPLCLRRNGKMGRSWQR